MGWFAQILKVCREVNIDTNPHYLRLALERSLFIIERVHAHQTFESTSVMHIFCLRMVISEF
jgi:hypothetical protein